MTDMFPTVESPLPPAWSNGESIELRKCMLIVESGPDKGRRFGPLGKHTTIGRELVCDIGLTDPEVSKEHCALTWTGESLSVRDLGSTNGIWFRGARLRDADLPPNSTFSLGNTLLRLELQEGTQTCRSEAMDPTRTLVGESAGMQNLFRAIQRFGRTDLSLLLLGETGTGKTAVAQALHKMSRRAEQRFVDVNCAAIAPGLIESELFGHVKGAFTGADRRKAGFFEQAAGGTVFLDEIGEMSYDLQVKLLKALETGTVRPVGADHVIPVDFRLVCATNKNLTVEMAEGRFRQDLYYRIAGVAVLVPPLRERMSDLPRLAEWLTIQLGNSKRLAGERCLVTSISPRAIRRLLQHNWPGNVRELENVILRAMAVAPTSTIEPEDILLTTWSSDDELASAPPTSDQWSWREHKASVAETYHIPFLRDLMAAAGGKVERAAEMSGLSAPGLTKLLERHGIPIPRRRSIPPLPVGPVAGFPRRPITDSRDRPTKVHNQELAAMVEEMMREKK